VKIKNGEDKEWGCVRVSSPAGTWYIANHDDDIERFSPMPGGGRRAVFSRDELNRMNPSLKEMTKEDKQELLSKIIDIKELIGGKVKSVEKISR
jgi:hypothetical protein